MIPLSNAAKTLGISKPELSKAINRDHLSAANGRNSPADPNALRELGVALRELLDAERQRSDEWRRNDERRTQTDKWREQAQRLLLAAPWVTPPPGPAAAPPRSRWRWWQRQMS